MKATNSVMKLSALSSVLGLSAFLIACSTPSENFDKEAKVFIPDLPPSVRHTEPKLPKSAAVNASDTAVLLQEYENASRKDKAAIAQAKAHNKKLQKLYNNPPKKTEESSSWFKFPLTTDFKLW